MALDTIKPAFAQTMLTVLTQTPPFVSGSREPHALGRKASGEHAVPPLVAPIIASPTGTANERASGSRLASQRCGLPALSLAHTWQTAGQASKAFRFFAALPAGHVHHVGVIGLGTGGLACYAAPGQDWTFYEIDPVVEGIVHDPCYFQSSPRRNG
jgi:hypothetical protein